MRTYPSSIVNYILENFVEGEDKEKWRKARFTGANDLNRVQPVVDLFDALTMDLVILDPEKQTELILAISHLRFALRNWYAGRMDYPLKSAAAIKGQHPVQALLSLMKECPDEAPAAHIAGLEFIDDQPLRGSIRRDLSSAHTARSHGEWKAATVLAGAVLEALLIWVLDRAGVQKRTDWWHAVGEKWGKPDDDLLVPQWTLERIIKVAHQGRVISETTCKAALISKDYRNLIHPGRAIRQQTNCGVDTAHFAIGAAEAVVRELTEARREQ